MPRVVYFEFTAEDPDRAATFYANVFGWETKRWNETDEYWTVKTGDENEPGINGGMMRRRDGSPNATTSIEVESVDDHLTKVTESGGVVVVPPKTIPTVGTYAYCKDTEGNIFCLFNPEHE